MEQTRFIVNFLTLSAYLEAILTQIRSLDKMELKAGGRDGKSKTIDHESLH
jgi:hypothetical protein